MASKFGMLAERIVGCGFWFVPDGSNLGTVEDPEITGPLAKPSSDADWVDFSLGRVVQSAYDPVTQERTRQWFSQTKKKYVQSAETHILADAFNITLVDYPTELFDQLMFGLATVPVDDTPQAVFATSVRLKDGWVRMKRWNEETRTLITLVDFHIRLTIQENPTDSSDVSSPILRIQHLGDSTDVLEVITCNPDET